MTTLIVPPPNEPAKINGSQADPSGKVYWLYLAFVPSLAALVLAKSLSTGQPLPTVLVVLNVICSVLASGGMVRGMNGLALQTVLALFLTAFFFAANTFVAEFTGCCSQMH